MEQVKDDGVAELQAKVDAFVAKAEYVLNKEGIDTKCDEDFQRLVDTIIDLVNKSE